MKTLYIKLIALFIGIAACLPMTAQPFTWKKGSNAIDQWGVYGFLGMPANANTPGAREGAISWTDQNNNLWLFGGTGRDLMGNTGLLNDLWKYDPITGQWTWIHGDQTISQPGVYGSIGVPAASNKPGSRQNPSVWTDMSGNLWLFGGYGHNNTAGLGLLNDLWKYTISSNEWTWMGGSINLYENANYGSATVPAASNMPGCRQDASSWTDGNGNLWMYGGHGYSTGNALGYLNDLWRYNIGTGIWTWMKGSNQINQGGAYGTSGISSPGNFPGARRNSHVWVEPGGNAWLFGGYGYDAATPLAFNMSDLWNYNISTNEWVWVKGPNTANQNGNYNVMGVATASTNPGSRQGGLTWIDVAGNMWLFGGAGLPATGSLQGHLNDLWKYDRTKNEWAWMANASVNDQIGTYGSLNVPSSTNRPGARTRSVSWIDNANNLWLFGGFGHAASGSPGQMNDLWKYNNCHVSPITMTIIAKDSMICAGESTSLTASGASNYQWIHNSSTQNNVVINPATSTVYTVNTLNSNGCIYSAQFTLTVNECTGLNAVSKSDNKISVGPNPSQNTLVIRGAGNSYLEIFNSLGAVVLRKRLTEGDTQISHELKNGIYYCRIKPLQGEVQIVRIVVVN